MNLLFLANPKKKAKEIMSRSLLISGPKDVCIKKENAAAEAPITSKRSFTSKFLYKTGGL